MSRNTHKILKTIAAILLGLSLTTLIVVITYLFTTLPDESLNLAKLEPSGIELTTNERDEVNNFTKRILDSGGSERLGTLETIKEHKPLTNVDN